MFSLPKAARCVCAGRLFASLPPNEVGIPPLSGKGFRNTTTDKKLKKGRGSVGKTPIMGLLERGGEGASQVKAVVIPDNSKASLHG